MLGLLKKKDFEAARTELEARLEERLAGLGERLQQAERRERRNQAALEGLLDGQESQLALLRQLRAASPPMEALMAFAENFALWRNAVSPTPETAVLARKFDELLRSFDLELAAEPGDTFDPGRHEACDVRFEPEKPANTVLEVVRPGFLSAGGVLRYATVVVNRSEQGTSS